MVFIGGYGLWMQVHGHLKCRDTVLEASMHIIIWMCVVKITCGEATCGAARGWAVLHARARSNGRAKQLTDLLGTCPEMQEQYKERLWLS